ncbi:MAG: hypothetical protein ACXVCT_22200, partial [Ktedonobacterales bacterium]
PGRTAADLRTAIERRETAPIGAFWRTREYVAWASHRWSTRRGALVTKETEGSATGRRKIMVAPWARQRQMVTEQGQTA